MENSNRINTVITNSIIYIISGLLQKCFSILLLPLYTSYLTTLDYGITNIANIFILTVNFIVAFSLYSSVMRFYIDYKDDEIKLKRFYGSIVTFIFISSIFFGILFFLFRGFLEKKIFGSYNYYPIILICSISLLFTCENSVYENILKSQQKAIKNSIISIIYFFIQIFLNIIFVVKYNMGAKGILLSTLISGFIYSLFFILDMVKNKEIEFCLDFEILKLALKYSIPIIPHNLSTRIEMLISSILIGNIVNMSTLGIYSVSSQFGSIADTILYYVSSAYMPWMFNVFHNGKKDRENINSATKIIVYFIGILFIGIALFSHDYIILFINKDYHSGWYYIPLKITINTFKILYYLYICILFYYKDVAKKLFIATLSSSIINVIFSYILIPKFKAYGSIYSDFIANAVCITIVICISKRYSDTGLNLKNLFKQIIIIISFIFIGLMPSYLIYFDRFSFINLFYKTIVLLIYFSIVIINNISQLKNIINKIILKRG